jgi:hypothetical protein
MTKKKRQGKPKPSPLRRQAQTTRPLEIAVIPDLHIHGHSDESIPRLLARWLDGYRPDVVVNLGDHWDMPSLAFQTQGQHSSAIGPTFRQDVDAGIRANGVIWASFQKSKARWNCRRIILEGNHENRMTRHTEEPENWALKGTLDYSILQADRFYDEVVRYVGSTPGIITVGGVSFRHYAVNGLARSLNSVHLGAQLNAKTLTSTVVGHSHMLSYARAVSSDGRVLHGLSAGCCIGEKDFHAYAGVGQQAWARGVCCLHGVANGDYSLEWVSLKRLRELFSKGGK